MGSDNVLDTTGHHRLVLKKKDCIYLDVGMFRAGNDTCTLASAHRESTSSIIEVLKDRNSSVLMKVARTGTWAAASMRAA